MARPMAEDGPVAECDNVAKACRAMRSWLAADPNPAPASPPRAKSVVNTSLSRSRASVSSPTVAEVDKLGSISGHAGLNPRLLIAHMRGRTSETSFNKSSVPARQTETAVDAAAPGHESSKSDTKPGAFGADGISQVQSPLSAPLLHGESCDEGPERSRSTWSVSDLDDGQVKEMDSSAAVRACRLTATRKDSGIPGPQGHCLSPLPAEVHGSFLERWLRDTAEPPSNVFLPNGIDDPALRQREVDACTGQLLPAIIHPDTITTLTQGPFRDCKDIGWRQANMTSELHIIRELKSRQRLGDQLRASFHQNQPAKALVEAPDLEKNWWPSANCTLRPATPADFQQIADIINLEMQSEGCPQVLESKTVDASDVSHIFHSCERSQRPLIVACPAEEDLLDRSKWPKNSDRVYQEFVKFRQAQPNVQPSVVGFAFVTEPRLGFLKASCPGSRFAAQVRVVVHPEHRQRSYGTALLDRILISVSPLYRSLIDYKWECPSPARIYESCASQNNRQYARVYAEMFCEGKDDADLKWRAEMFGKFNFEKAAHLGQAVKTDRPGHNKWLDLVLWEFEAQPLSAIGNRAQ